MEGHVDSFEGDSCEATLEVNWLWLGFCLLGAFPDNFYEVLLDIFEGHCLHEGLDINLLRLEVIRDVR